MAFGNVFLNLSPKKIKINSGNAAPRAYPMIAPMPPHVAAEAGPNNIQAPNADETKLVVKENVPISLLATK